MATLEERLEQIMTKIRAKEIKLHPPLGVDQIEAFESKHSIRLPEEYRRFLIEIGNGGQGPPAYGLFSLGEMPSEGPERSLGDLGKPFPLTKHWVWEDEEYNEEAREAIEHGRLFLGNDGCTMYWILIVTGPERGQVWQTADVGIQPCAPPRDFLSWYEYWLDGGDDWWAGFTPS